MSFQSIKRGVLAAAFTVAAGGLITFMAMLPASRHATQKELQDQAVSALQKQDFKDPVFLSSAEDPHGPDLETARLRFQTRDAGGVSRIVEVDVKGYVADSAPPKPYLRTQIVSVATP